MRMLAWVEYQLDAFYKYRLERKKCLACDVVQYELEQTRMERDRLISKLLDKEITKAPGDIPNDEAEDEWDIVNKVRLGSTRRNQLTRQAFAKTEALKREFEASKSSEVATTNV